MADRSSNRKKDKPVPRGASGKQEQQPKKQEQNKAHGKVVVEDKTRTTAIARNKNFPNVSPSMEDEIKKGLIARPKNYVLPPVGEEVHVAKVNRKMPPKGALKATELPIGNVYFLDRLKYTVKGTFSMDGFKEKPTLGFPVFDYLNEYFSAPADGTFSLKGSAVIEIMVLDFVVAIVWFEGGKLTAIPNVKTMTSIDPEHKTYIPTRISRGVNIVRAPVKNHNWALFTKMTSVFQNPNIRPVEFTFIVELTGEYIIHKQ